jgi:hypothetical protein
MNACDALTKILETNPDLVFDNDGYENLSPKIVEANKDAIKSVEAILEQCIWGFVSFQNFKPRKDGSIAARYQVRYNDEGSFVGVTYTDLKVLTVYQVKETA